MRDQKPPPAFLRFMDKSYDLIAGLCTFIAGVSLVVMTTIFAWLVFGRYVLNDTPTWVEQVSLLLVMVIAFLGAAVGIHQNVADAIEICSVVDKGLERRVDFRKIRSAVGRASTRG